MLTLPTTLLLLALPAPAAAGDVLLPDFTARTVSDFSLADDLTVATAEALGRRGLVFVDGRALADVVGADADSCAEDRACPGRLLRYVGGDVVVVGSTTFLDGQVDARAWLYVPGTEAPVATLDERFLPEDMDGFADQVARAAAEHVEGAGDGSIVVPPRQGYQPRSRDDSRADPPVASSVRDGLDEPDEDPVYRDEARYEDVEYSTLDDVPQLTEEELDAERRAMGALPWPVYNKYRASGLSQDEWLERARLRTGHVLVELHLGAVLGDLDRRYDTRVAVERQTDGSLEQLDVYEYETFTNGTGLLVGASVSYVPVYWLDIGLYGGVQLGRKNLSTGWELQDGGDLEDSEVEVFDPAAATMAAVQPRARIYLSPTGTVKPYVLAAFDLRVYDGYVTPDLEEINYPDRAGGYSYGPTLGGGLAFDAPSVGTAFIEIPWTYLLAPLTPSPSGGTELTQLPEAYTPLQQYITPRIGFGTRF